MTANGKVAGRSTCALAAKNHAANFVTGIFPGTAYFKAAGWDKERAFNTVGKYVCACGPSCDRKTISQKPGKCGCGHELKKV